jgi:hypothetical protein
MNLRRTAPASWRTPESLLYLVFFQPSLNDDVWPVLLVHLVHLVLLVVIFIFFSLYLQFVLLQRIADIYICIWSLRLH